MPFKKYHKKAHTVYILSYIISKLIRIILDDVDECALWNVGANSCDENAVCINTSGSYTCTCNEGYYGDGKSCLDLSYGTSTIFPYNPE